MPKKNNQEVATDTNAWMTTYTDLMILLLTFFVLLLSLSVVDPERKRVALNSLVGAFGFKPGGQAILGTLKGLNITIGSAPIKKEDIDFEQLRNVNFKNGLEDDANVIQEGERNIILLSHNVLFNPGSSKIEPKGIQYLSDLTPILLKGPNKIELRGYCSSSEVIMEPILFEASMKLSTKRAFAVYNFFREVSKIPPNRLVAHGFGTIPIRKGDTIDKIQKNRHVEIILDYKETIPRRLKSSKQNSLLDFKGFLFRVPGRN